MPLPRSIVVIVPLVAPYPESAYVLNHFRFALSLADPGVAITVVMREREREMRDLAREHRSQCRKS